MKQFCMSKRFWKELRPVIPQKRGVGRPRKGAKKIMRALFYILRIGIPWKALPSDFKVSSSAVHRRFQEWVKADIFREFWKKVLTKYQKKHSKMMQWVAIDGSHSKSPLGGDAVGKSPVDRRKIGTKKHICVDQNGVAIGFAISAANKHDNCLVQDVINSIPVKLTHSHVVCAADSAYDAKNTRIFLRKQGFIPLISQNKSRSKKPITKTTSRHRWIVEHTFGHFNRWRGVSIRWNKKLDNYLAALQIAATFYTLRHL